MAWPVRAIARVTRSLDAVARSTARSSVAAAARWSPWNVSSRARLARAMASTAGSKVGRASALSRLARPTLWNEPRNQNGPTNAARRTCSSSISGRGEVGEGGQYVGVFASDRVEAQNHVIIAEELGRVMLRVGQVIVGVGVADGRFLPARHQSLQPILPDRLQHAEAGRAVEADPARDEAVVDERGNEIKDGGVNFTCDHQNRRPETG